MSLAAYQYTALIDTIGDAYNINPGFVILVAAGRT